MSLGAAPALKRTLIVGLLGALIFLLAHPAMLGLDGRVLIPGWDLTRIFWADLAYLHRALREGSLPLWNPYDRMGYSFVADPQSAIYDPITWLLIVPALALNGVSVWWIVGKTVLYFGILASGMDAFSRNRRLPNWLIAVTVVALLLCARIDKMKDASWLWPIAWVGWLLFAIDRWVARPASASSALLALVAASVVVAGYPPYAFRLALWVAPFFFALVVESMWRTGNPVAHLRSLLSGLAWTTVLIAALVAAAVTATISDLPGSAREVLGEREVLRSSITRADGLFALIAPSRKIAPSLLYVGLVPLWGAILALALERRRLTTWMLALTGAVGFFLACGKHSFLLPYLTRFTPFAVFRIAEHYALLPVLSILLLGAAGMHALAGRPRTAAVAWAAAALAVLLLLARLGSMYAIDAAPATRLAAATGIVACGAAVVFSLVSSRWRNAAGWALAIATAFDVWVAARPVAKILQPIPNERHDRAVAGAMADRDRHATRMADFESASRRIGTRLGLLDFAGHRPAMTDRHYLVAYKAAEQAPQLLASMSVGVVALAWPNRVAVRELPRAPGTGADDTLRELPGAWPRAFWTSDHQLVGDDKSVLRALQEAVSPRAIFRARDAPRDLPERSTQPLPVPARPAQITFDRANRLEIEVNAPAAGWLVVTDSYHPSWRAIVDGTPAPLYRCNLLQRAVPLSAGRHRVTLVYRPMLVIGLSVVWLVTLLGCLFVVFRDATRHAKSNAIA